MSQDSKRPPSAFSRLGLGVGVSVLKPTARALLASWRIQQVSGEAYLWQAIDSGRALMPCCWHQRLSASVGYLLKAQSRGLKPGFLVSPSRDGEITARVVEGMGAHIIRGSATRTGARAMRDLYGVMKTGVIWATREVELPSRDWGAGNPTREAQASSKPKTGMGPAP